MRYPKDEIPELAWGGATVELGKAEVLRLGVVQDADVHGRLMIWAYGTLVRTAWEALRQLAGEAAGVTLVNARFAKPIDRALLAELAASPCPRADPRGPCADGGLRFGAEVTAADLGLALQIHRGGVRDELVAHASREQQLAAQGLDVGGVIARVRDLISRQGNEPIPFVRTGLSDGAAGRPWSDRQGDWCWDQLRAGAP